MLIVKAFINDREIEEIWIHNTSNCVNTAFGIWEYRIRKPEGYGHLPIYHRRNKGWMALALDVMKIIDCEERKKDGN